jgi:hypothetical protein
LKEIPKDNSAKVDKAEERNAEIFTSAIEGYGSSKYGKRQG